MAQRQGPHQRPGGAGRLGGLLKDRDHTSALVGLAASAACLALFGPDDFIIPAMLAILGSLTLLRGTLERKGALA